MSAARPVEAALPLGPTFSRRYTRRSVILGTAIAIAAFPSCALLNPSDNRPGSSGGDRLPAGSTPTGSSLFGVVPRPAAATSSPTPEPIVVRFGHWESGDARIVLDDTINSFSQTNSTIVVRPEILPFGDHFERLQRGLASGDAPDTFVSSGPYFYRHSADGRLLDLSAYATADGIRWDDYWNDPTTSAQNGVFLDVPLWGSVDLVYLNRDHMEKAGAAMPSESWTWVDLLALARQLTVGKPGDVSRWGLYVVNDLVGGWGCLATSNGGTWIDAVSGKTRLDQATVDALKWVADAMNVHHVAPRPIDQQAMTRGGTIDPFLTGAVSLFLNGSWEIATALKDGRFQWDIVKVPRAPRTDASVSLKSIQPGCAARATHHPDESWRFLRYLLDPASQRRWSAGKVRIPSLKSASTDPSGGYGTPPPQNASAVTAALTNATDPRFTINWQGFRSALVDALDPAFNGQTDLGNAIRLATQNGDSALKG